MVVTDLEGNVLEGSFNPSSDLQTHLELYKAWPELAGLYTHSTEAVGWAQSGLDIPFLGTTHADYFHGPIPCTRSLTYNEVEDAYEKKQEKSLSKLLKNENLIQRLFLVLSLVIMVRLHGVKCFTSYLSFCCP